MASVRSKNTTPEIVVRKLCHRLGFRFRLHRKDLPGTPDLVFPRVRKVIFVHGCFWHRHEGCPKATTPKTRQAFWTNKFLENVKRDKRNVRELKSLGWDVEIIWECQTQEPEQLAERLLAFLN